jgi:thiamine kinase-like enzyme
VITEVDFDPIFKRIPSLCGLDRNNIRISKLPGYTNNNFRLQGEAEDWVLRIPKNNTNQYINRQVEANNACIAEALGLAPKCRWRDQNGLSLTRTLTRTRPVSQDDFKKTTISRQLVDSIRSLHDCEQNFLGQVVLVDLLTRYYQLMPASYRELAASVYRFAQYKANKLSSRDEQLLPSHNDLVQENILIDDTGRIWIIDWEYSSMASPYWDLATVCNSFELDRTQSRELLDSYLQHTAVKGFDTLMDYRYVLQVLSICWIAAFTDSDITSKIECLCRNPGFETAPEDRKSHALL